MRYKFLMSLWHKQIELYFFIFQYKKKEVYKGLLKVELFYTKLSPKRTIRGKTDKNNSKNCLVHTIA